MPQGFAAIVNEAFAKAFATLGRTVGSQV